MKNMIYKEWRLAMHPASLLFLLLAAMMLIPNYPYYVSFFYVTLGIFFLCLSGRENNDVFYSMTLPATKCDVAAARFVTAIMLEVLQILLAVPFAYLRSLYPADILKNAAGMDANAALFGFGLMMLGVFNFVFFTKYYKDVTKVGVAFLLGATAEGVFMVIAEGCAFAVPFVRDTLDTPGMQNPVPKLIVLICGAVIYALLTFIAYKISVKRFEALDI